MRFEEQVNHVVVRYPELRVYGPQPATPRPFREEVAKGVAVGRRLHGKFWRETVTRFVAKPVVAAVRRIATARAYRETLRSLERLEDHRLQDIGIERSEIRAVARALAYGDTHPRVTSREATRPAATKRPMELPKAA